MFAFEATPWKYVGLLVLFGWSAAWCIYELTRDQDGRQRTSNILHLLMAVVMLAMVPGWAWSGLTAIIPSWVLTVVFGLATAWFVWSAVRSNREVGRRGSAHLAGHAAMFGAMTWHLAAMAVMSAGMAAGQDSHDHAGHGGHDHGAMGHDGGGAGWMEQASEPGGALWLLAVIGLPFMIYLLVASVGALVRVFRPAAGDAGPPVAEHTAAEHVVGSGAAGAVAVAAPVMAHSCREVRPVGSLRYRLEALTDFAMNSGMFWMSTGLLVPVLPFFANFAF